MTRVSVTRKISVRDPSVLPAWVPEPGTFKDISTNTLLSARPAGWPASDIAGPFMNWSGGVYAPDFGTDGGLAIFGSGHLSQGYPLWAGVWVLDLATLGWVGRNVPAEPLLENAASYDGYGLSTVPATLGHPYPPHTYDGLLYRPAALGGGVDGQLIQAGAAGASLANGRRVLAFDLSSATAPPTMVVTDVPGLGNTYPACADDHARGGFWATDGIGQGGLSFVSYADWSVTSFPSVGFNTYGTTSLIYVPDRDCLVAISHAGDMYNMYTVVRVCPIVNDVPQGWVLVSMSGTAPDASSGGVWSTILGCIVSYRGIPSYTTDISQGYVVHKLALPANLVSGVWAWATETLTGVGGAVPTMSRDGNNAYLNNGTWSRFVEVPSARCFLFAGSVNGPAQAWRLTGM